jgi:hypothetical protein
VHPPVISPLAEDSQKLAGEFDPVENQATNAESGARGQQLDIDEIDIARDVAQQGRATAPQSELTPPECLSLALRQRHSGALPQLPSRKRADNSE